VDDFFDGFQRVYLEVLFLRYTSVAQELALHLDAVLTEICFILKSSDKIKKKNAVPGSKENMKIG
jgi:hypothetical protein